MAQLCLTVLVALAFASMHTLARATACTGCTGCINNDPMECTGCEPGYHFVDNEGDDGTGSCFFASCQWREEDAQDWYNKILAGSIVGGIITLATTFIASLPVCCGVWKDSNLKCIGNMVGMIAGLSLAIPAITGAATSGQVVDDVCNDCDNGCTDQERDDVRAAIRALGMYVAYTAGFGFIVVVLGIVSMGLSCCVCCPCCGPLRQHQLAKTLAAQGAQGQVVDRPAC